MLGPKGSASLYVTVSTALDSIVSSGNGQSVRFRNCDIGGRSESFSVVKAYPVLAGAHFVHLMIGAQEYGLNDPGLRVYARATSLQLLFVDQDGMGGS